MRTNDNRLQCYYHSGGAIFLSLYENGGWRRKGAVISNAREDFTLNIDRNNHICLFCQDIQGNMLLYTDKEGAPQTQVIMQANKNASANLMFNSVTSGSRYTLVYNIPNDDRSHCLAIQSLDGKGRWSEAAKLDRLIPLPGGIFRTRHVTDGHALIFYQTRIGDNILGYREINAERSGSYMNFYATPYQIADVSFLTSDKDIHLAFILKSIFSSKLVYRKRDEAGFSKPVAVWESPRLEKCVISVVKDQIYIHFTANGVMYICISCDGGASFSKPRQFDQPSEVMKAVYVSSRPAKEADFCCGELFVSKADVCDILILPNIYPEFYPLAPQITEPPKKTEPQADITAAQKPKAERQNDYYTDMDFFNRGFAGFENKTQAISPELKEREEIIDKLLNQVSELSKDNALKTKQLEETSIGLRQKNAEFDALENRYKLILKAQDRELEELKNEIKTCRLKNE